VTELFQRRPEMMTVNLSATLREVVVLLIVHDLDEVGVVQDGALLGTLEREAVEFIANGAGKKSFSQTTTTIMGLVRVQDLVPGPAFHPCTEAQPVAV